MSFILNSQSGASNLTINNVPIIGNNVSIGIQDIPGLSSIIESSVTDSSTDTFTNKTLDDVSNSVTCDAIHSKSSKVVIDKTTDPQLNQTLLISDDVTPTASWNTIDHTKILNIGTNSHSVIDDFISSKSVSGGLCPLDTSAKIPLSCVPAIALVSVQTCNLLSDRDNLINVQEGDVAIVTGDTDANNGSYIYIYL